MGVFAKAPNLFENLLQNLIKDFPDEDVANLPIPNPKYEADRSVENKK